MPADDKASRSDAAKAWLLMQDLVLDNARRREVSEALGISFARVRAVRRIARRPMSMGDLATALTIDPPNATVVVDDLQDLDLVDRHPHPDDRRTTLVEATPKGRDLARQADEILATPPPALKELSGKDLEALHRILAAVASRGEGATD